MLVDFDPQGNASSGLGVEIEEHEHTVYDLMAEEAGLDECLDKMYRIIWMYFLLI